MRIFTCRAIAAAATGAIALGVATGPAAAADVPAPEYQQPPAADNYYGNPPPAEYGYRYAPPVNNGYPYAAPPVVVGPPAVVGAPYYPRYPYAPVYGGPIYGAPVYRGPVYGVRAYAPYGHRWARFRHHW